LTIPWYVTPCRGWPSLPILKKMLSYRCPPGVDHEVTRYMTQNISFLGVRTTNWAPQVALGPLDFLKPSLCLFSIDCHADFPSVGVMCTHSLTHSLYMEFSCVAHKPFLTLLWFHVTKLEHSLYSDERQIAILVDFKRIWVVVCTHRGY
jgi:hypothetical protein